MNIDHNHKQTFSLFDLSNQLNDIFNVMVSNNARIILLNFINNSIKMKHIKFHCFIKKLLITEKKLFAKVIRY